MESRLFPFPSTNQQPNILHKFAFSHPTTSTIKTLQPPRVDFEALCNIFLFLCLRTTDCRQVIQILFTIVIICDDYKWQSSRSNWIRVLSCLELVTFRFELFNFESFQVHVNSHIQSFLFSYFGFGLLYLFSHNDAVVRSMFVYMHFVHASAPAIKVPG